MKDFINEMEWRGFLNQASNLASLTDWLNSGSRYAYIGFDPTAKSLHVGNLMGLVLLRWFGKFGHKPIALLGGATGKIGDPSGRLAARSLQTAAEVKENGQGILENFKRILPEATIVDNSDWLEKIGYIDFLGTYGVNFSLNKMLTFDSVKNRLDKEEHVSFLEFNYMILQAIDFVELYKRYDCRLQMGGSDQWGNIVNGINLGRKMYDVELFALTCPLLTRSDGQKMGKSVSGAIWLDPTLLKPYEFWQFWRNIPDADVGKLLRLFTELEQAEILKLEQLQGSEINAAKIILADEVTRIVHGFAVIHEIHQTVQNLFAENKNLAEGEGVAFYLKWQEKISLLDLIIQVGFCKSKSEAKRAIESGSIYLNREQIFAWEIEIAPVSLGSSFLLSFGKKKHVVCKPENL